METTYLKHHGIKGQKWGVRNGPPYPLNSKTMSSSEKKAGATSGSATKKKPKYYSAAQKSGKTGGYSDMTDEELITNNKRKALESNYRKYQSEEKKLELSKLEKANQVAELVKNSNQSIEKAANDAFRDYHKYQKSQIDLSKVSDDELRKVVNRMNLEQQYRNLLPDDVSKGEIIAKNALSILSATSVAAVAALGTVMMIKKMM